MANKEVNVVTGAFGYTGRSIAQRLLSTGKEVRTLTNHPNPQNPLASQIQAFPYSFDHPQELADSLRGADTLFNTYWVRFPYRGMTFERAVENSRALIRAAEQAGVRRLVHVSITNAREDSPLPYFRGKGLVEKAIRESRLSYAILRPTVVFGPGDILLNNIAWFLRKFPLFPVTGRGEYLVQPVYMEDLAEQAVRAASQDANTVADAVGPEVYPYEGLVRLVAQEVQARARIVHVPPGVGLFLSRLAGLMVRDVVLTRDEVDGLMAGLLVSQGPATGETRLSRWLQENRHSLGVRYASELRRHYR